LPDDRLYVALLTTRVALVAVLTYLLLEWASARLMIAIAGSCITTVAFQSSQHDRQDPAQSVGHWFGMADFRP
jgi:hypothetical protein